MPARRTLALVAGVLLLAAGCSKGGSGSGPTPNAQFEAEVATSFLYANHPLDVEVGLFSATPSGGVQLVTFGSVQVTFVDLGSGREPAATGTAGSPVTAAYLPAPTTRTGGSTPSLSDPSTARGVYDAHAITFLHAGWYAARVSAEVAGAGRVVETSTPVPVYPKPVLPAPGQRALKTDNLTMSTPGVHASWLDSMAQGDEVPDPILHRWTIAKALTEHRPIVIVFATPAYCTSQFCGPTTDAVAQLAKTYANRAVFIHIEIYKTYTSTAHVLNQAAAQWLYRNNDLTEPWTYLVGADGIIKEQWGPLFPVDRLAQALRALPPMKG
jgi:hypothetical protein